MAWRADYGGLRGVFGRFEGDGRVKAERWRVCLLGVLVATVLVMLMLPLNAWRAWVIAGNVVVVLLLMFV